MTQRGGKGSRLSPGVGIGVAALATPAFVRAALAGRKLPAQGASVGIAENVLLFFTSLGVVVSTVTAGGIAFYATCWGGFLGGAFVSSELGVKGYDDLFHGLVTGVIVGAVFGLGVLAFMLRWLWPLHTKPTESHDMAE